MTKQYNEEEKNGKFDTDKHEKTVCCVCDQKHLRQNKIQKEYEIGKMNEQ